MAMRRNNKILIGGVVAVVAALVAAGFIAAAIGDSDDGDPSGRTSAVTTTVPVPATTTAPAPDPDAAATTPDTSSAIAPAQPDAADGTRIGLDDAAARAAAHTPGKVIAIELDDHRGRMVWEVHVVTGSAVVELTLDARTGEIVDTETDHDDDDVATAARATLSATDAAATAVAAVPGEVHSVELDDHRGTPVYEVDIVTDRTVVEVLVDAVTGAVLRPAGGTTP